MKLWTRAEKIEWRKEIRWFAQQYVERANALAYKGKKRDDAAVDYMCGIATGLKASKRDSESEWLGRIIYLEIATRGFLAINMLANQTDEHIEETTQE